MAEQQQELLGKYRAVPDILYGLTAGISEAAARVGGADADSWSIVEIVCHLRDAEERSLERTRLMRDQTHPTLYGYDEQELAAAGRYREQSLAAVTDQFCSLRRQHIRELEALRADDWLRSATHDQMGELTIQTITHHMTYHDAAHLAQIARRVAAARGPGSQS
jgi:hypothetical protein